MRQMRTGFSCGLCVAGVAQMLPQRTPEQKDPRPLVPKRQSTKRFRKRRRYFLSIQIANPGVCHSSRAIGSDAVHVAGQKLLMDTGWSRVWRR